MHFLYLYFAAAEYLGTPYFKHTKYKEIKAKPGKTEAIYSLDVPFMSRTVCSYFWRKFFNLFFLQSLCSRCLLFHFFWLNVLALEILVFKSIHVHLSRMSPKQFLVWFVEVSKLLPVMQKSPASSRDDGLSSSCWTIPVNSHRSPTLV